MHSMIRTLGPIVVLLMLSACRKTETVPAYLEIPALTVDAGDLQGGNTSRITDVWVTVDEKSVGVWELPARIPVIGAGAHTIGVTAGIKRNGAYDDRVRYPYYTIWRGTVNIEPGATTTVAPVVQYTASTIWSERFNDAGSRLVSNVSSDTTLLLISPTQRPEAVLDGTQCGGFVLDQQNDLVALQTEEDFPGTTRDVYMELDYSADIDITIGFTYLEEGVTRYEPYVILVATASTGSIRWNKVYIDLSQYFMTPGISGRDIYIGAQLSGGRTTAAGYFDNLKIVSPGS